MPEFKTMQEVEAELAKHVPIVKQITGKDITLQRISPLMKRLGNPEKKLRIIHVAGTSGKTSTCYYLAAMFQTLGKTGLTVSPHIDSLTERLQINGRPVSDEEFCRAFSEFMEIVDGVDPDPSYFELVIALAYWYFSKVGVDYAVIETGLGGSHDATNIAQEPGKVCVITDIGIDHTKFLGTTVETIAAQKAGIIHKGNQVYMYEQAPGVVQVFKERTEKIGAQLELVDQVRLAETHQNDELAELPEFQQRNWLLARHVFEQVAKTDNRAIDQQKLLPSLHLTVPGRMEVRRAGEKQLVLDGAHNYQKCEAFARSFQALFPGRKVPILLAMKEGKEYQEVLPLLKPFCSKLILTTFDVIQDLPAKSIDPELLKKFAEQLGIRNIEIIKDPKLAYQALIKTPADLAVVTGSFYLISVVRPFILKA